EEAWEQGRSIIAPRVIDDPRVQGFESLYRANISSLAILPLALSSTTMRGAVYLNNPRNLDHLAPPLGSAALVAYQNLLQLTIPRAIPVPA
ncbi:MAG: hypothetical protein KDC38_09095, partial [Planctomycetes bacterium]|nr:hypothetical protein [Planctomycetota bacterium]